jgi:hypothetical protein
MLVQRGIHGTDRRKLPEPAAQVNYGKCQVFDDRDYGINKKNAEAITNFLQRSSFGLAMDSILQTPFFAISQSQNVGLQLADLVTAVIGLRFSSHRPIEPHFAKLRQCIPYYKTNEGHMTSCLKVLRRT